jgi:copper chaperone CopZ
MSEYHHHIHGRLRVRVRALKNASAAATHTAAAIKAIDGITSVEIKVVTGSVLICYDPARISFPTLQEKLATLLGTMLLQPATTKGEATAFSERLFGMLLEKCTERSALALVGVLI